MDHQSGSVTYRQLGNVWRKIPQLAPCLDIAIGNEYVIIKTKFVLVSKSIETHKFEHGLSVAMHHWHWTTGARFSGSAGRMSTIVGAEKCSLATCPQVLLLASSKFAILSLRRLSLSSLPLLLHFLLVDWVEHGVVSSCLKDLTLFLQEKFLFIR